MRVLEDEGIRRCYYGHLHGPATRAAVTGEREGIRFSLISADYLSFCPKLVPAGWREMLPLHSVSNQPF